MIKCIICEKEIDFEETVLQIFLWKDKSLKEDCFLHKKCLDEILDNVEEIIDEKIKEIDEQLKQLGECERSG